MLALSESPAPLLGREAEVQLLSGLLDDVEQGGAALVLRGEPGIGKSRLLGEATALAEERKMNVLASRGVQSEARLAFAGLQQLLRPVRSQAAGLSPRTRPCWTLPWASVTTNRRSTFVSPWQFSTCYRTRRPIAPCSLSPRTHIGLTSLR